MKLWQVQRHWDELAKADPLWAVLTESEKQGRRWSVDEFFSTGVAEVGADMARVRQLEPGFSGRTALDFGCGAGRLTQALARHFDRVTGVDISGRMIALARGHSGNSRVDFVHNPRADLRRFPGGSFDFVYSRITLQHIAPRYTRRYLAEFARVLAPGGILSRRCRPRCRRATRRTASGSLRGRRRPGCGFADMSATITRDGSRERPRCRCMPWRGKTCSDAWRRAARRSFPSMGTAAAPLRT